MAISKKIEEAINKQINAELYSAYLYLSMSAYLENINLPGFASWMRIQFQEEQAHAMGMIDYLMERGGRVVLAAIEAPKVEYANVIEVFEDTLEHEKLVTSMISDIAKLASEKDDYATRSFMNWYIKEQVEEEATAEIILSQLKMIKGEGYGMLMIDRELGARVFNPPVIG